jgi:hypothetical protein
MDPRVGGATEAEEVGATVQMIKSALTHTKESTTLRYIRRRSEKITGAVRISAAPSGHEKTTAEQRKNRLSESRQNRRKEV